MSLFTNPKAIARAFLSALRRFEWLVAGLGLAFVTVTVIGDVVMRELGSGGIHGASRLAVMAMIVTGFIGIALASDGKQHLRITVFDVSWRSLEPIRESVDYAVSGILLLGFAWYGYLFALSTFELNERTVFLDMPLWPAHAAIPYAFFSYALRSFLLASWPDLSQKVDGEI